MSEQRKERIINRDRYRWAQTTPLLPTSDIKSNQRMLLVPHLIELVKGIQPGRRFFEFALRSMILFMFFRCIHRLEDSHVHQLHALYQRQWWSKGRRIEDVRIMLRNCDLIVGLMEENSGNLSAFARAISDRVYKAMIFDVMVDESCRGTGLGRRLINTLLDHPVLREVEHVELYCLPDVAGFYEQWGFTVEIPGVRLMRRTR